MRDPWRNVLDAPPYVVTCVVRERDAGDGHEHVLAVETRDPDGGRTRWATPEVVRALREGEEFLVDEDGSSFLERASCERCAAVTVSISPGGTEIGDCD